VSLLADSSDEALVAAFVAGEQAAFDQLVDRHARRVYAICLRYFGNQADAEDATQETFLALYRRARTFSGAAKFSTWIYRVATNACHDIGRKRSRRPQPSGQDPSHEIWHVAAEDLLTRRELGLELADALEGLEPEYREPILLHDVAGLPYADIAARLGVPIGTVKSRSIAGTPSWRAVCATSAARRWAGTRATQRNHLIPSALQSHDHACPQSEGDTQDGYL
jgi:RNA polymerase sigma-70 factor (ECF subfamily)